MQENNNNKHMSPTHKHSSEAVIKMFVMSDPSSVASAHFL